MAGIPSSAPMLREFFRQGSAVEKTECGRGVEFTWYADMVMENADRPPGQEGWLRRRRRRGGGSGSIDKILRSRTTTPALRADPPSWPGGAIGTFLIASAFLELLRFSATPPPNQRPLLGSQ
jgi:hypothetical protein